MEFSTDCNCKYKAYCLVCCSCGKKAVLSEKDSKEKKLKEMRERLQQLINEI